jgi:ribosomal protein S18 acetylase RimI-like enzyme
MTTKIRITARKNDLTNASDITIARAAPDDVVGMQNVAYHGWMATYPNAEHRITVDDIEDRFKDRHDEENISRGRGWMANPPDGQTTLIAKEGGRIVGFCRATRHPDRNQIHAIYVLPEYHGRGIGTAMWQAAQQYLDSSRHSIVEVATYNAKAIRFYRGLGFKDTGKRISDPKLKMKSGAVIPQMEMRREAGCGA